MKTGFINQRIQIYSKADTSMMGGGSIPGNTLYWDTNATVKQLRSSRVAEAHQDPIRQVFSFKVRYRKDKNILQNMLVKWRGQWFAVVELLPDAVYNVEMSFTASSVQSANIVGGTNEMTT